MNTRHATTRAQQRGLPPLVDQLLDRYGEEQHDGHGGLIVYLSKISIRNMERDLGRRPVAKFAEWHNAYKVMGADGRTITFAHRTHRIRRP